MKLNELPEWFLDAEYSVELTKNCIGIHDMLIMSRYIVALLIKYKEYLDDFIIRSTDSEHNLVQLKKYPNSQVIWVYDTQENKYITEEKFSQLVENKEHDIR